MENKMATQRYTLKNGDFNDPIRIQLMELLERVRNAETMISDILGATVGNSSDKCEELSLFIHDRRELEKFIQRLSMCTSSKEWAMHAIYPLYEDGYITAKEARSKRFIEMTIPHCKNMTSKSYSSLVKQLRRYCDFPE